MASVGCGGDGGSRCLWAGEVGCAGVSFLFKKISLFLPKIPVFISAFLTRLGCVSFACLFDDGGVLILAKIEGSVFKVRLIWG